MRHGGLGFGVVGLNPRIRRAILAGVAGSRRASLAAICSRDFERASAAASEFGGRPYSSFSEMVADPAVEAVFICTPHELHRPMAITALTAGKLVVCEKPLARTISDAEAMVLAARATGRPSLVNFTYHSLPGHRLIARLLGEGAIGKLRHLDLSYWQSRQALPGALVADALLDLGSHQVDLASWWCQLGGAGEIDRLAGLDDCHEGGDVPIFAAIARTTGGAVVSLQADRLAASWRNGMIARLVGEAGCLTLNFDTDRVDVDLACFGDGCPEGVSRRVEIPPDLAVGYSDFPAFHVDRLVAALRGEVEFPNFEYGLRCQTLLAGLRQATDEGCWVTIGAEPS